MNHLHFVVDLKDVATSYVDISLTIGAIGELSELKVALPVWTPGSYLIREYAQYLTHFNVVDEDDKKRKAHKRSKSTWVVDCHGAKEVTLRYRVYGQTLNVRYNHFDDTHAFIHGPASFVYVEGFESQAIDVEIRNTEWTITTGLEKKSEFRFQACDYDELIDCPFEIGTHDRIEFRVHDTPHRFSFWGKGNYDKTQIAKDTSKIIESASSIFASTLPYASFDFITLLTEKDYGGLEHRNSTALMVPRNSFREEAIQENPSLHDKKYRQFLGLVSHEFFHTWNVKRIKPAAFDHFDYQKENYTRDMWTVEGITSYYDDLILQRAELISRQTYLDGVAKMITRLHETPGRKTLSLEDASLDTWIRLYRPDPHNHNSNVSYYLKGSLISLLLDLRIRKESEGKKSLDDVMRYLWTHHAEGVGYPEGSYQGIVEKVCDIDLDSFFARFIRGSEDPDWNSYFRDFDLLLEWEAENLPYFGASISKGKVTKVDDGSPAFGKLHPGDEIIAFNKSKLSEDISALLKTCNAADRVTLTGFRNGVLFEVEVELGDAKAGKYTLHPHEEENPEARRRLDAWLKS